MLRMLKYVALLLPLASCTYNYIESEEVPELVSYESHVQPIFSDNCVSCHNGNYANPNLKEDVSYDALISGEYINTETPTESKLIKKMEDKHYGDSPTASEIELITKWIKEGALNN